MNERRDPAANHKKSKRSCFYNLGIFGVSGDLLRLKKKKTLVTLFFLNTCFWLFWSNHETRAEPSLLFAKNNVRCFFPMTVNTAHISLPIFMYEYTHTHTHKEIGRKIII